MVDPTMELRSGLPHFQFHHPTCTTLLPHTSYPWKCINSPVNLDVATIAKGPIRTKPAQGILSTSSFYEYFYG